MHQHYHGKRVLAVLAVLALALATVLAGTAQAAPNAQNATCDQTYVVQKGDWLSKIALRYLGSATSYPAIQSATNEAAKTDSSFATIANANRIEVGMKLCIPAPASQPTPATGPVQGGLAPITGSYSAQLPAADAVGRVIVLDLAQDNKATLTTQFIGKGDPIVSTGTWNFAEDKLTVQLTGPNGDQTLTFMFQNGALVLQDPVAAGYGTNGLTLQRAPSGNTRAAEFGGVTFRYDSTLAQSVQGVSLKAVPVQEGPALGGGMPAAVRFLFNGQKAQDYFDPHLAQVVVYKAADWAALDPSMAQELDQLKTILKDKPTDFPNGIPLFPPQGAQQVFRVKPQYLDFVNGSGVAFVSYYAQDVSPITSDRVFYTFEGLTNDGKYLVTAFWPVTTALLPKDVNAGLGGQSYEEWAKNYTTYLSQLVAQLNALLPAAYTPNLNTLNALVTSIEVADTTLP